MRVDLTQIRPYHKDGKKKADVLIKSLDEFAKEIKEKTVIILDNAPFYHAKIFKNKTKEWQKVDLYVWYLPSYSPHLI